MDLNSRLNRNLTRLIAAAGVSATQSATRLAQALPLSHGMSIDCFQAICRSGVLYSQKRLVAEGMLKARVSTETQMKTDGFVFFFVGPFAYPSAGCGFLFKANLEQRHRGKGQASPFDSGGLLKVFGLPDPHVAPIDFLSEHVLPIPEHRDLLAVSLTRQFHQPGDYLDKIVPRVPTLLNGGDRRRWTHEVRIEADLPIKTDLEAVFLARHLITVPQVVDFLTNDVEPEVHIQDFNLPRTGGIKNGFKLLTQECHAYLKETYL